MAFSRISGTSTASTISSTRPNRPSSDAYGIVVKVVQSGSVPAKIAVEKVVNDLEARNYALRRAEAASEVAELKAPVTLNLALAGRAKNHVRSLLRRGSNAAPDARMTPAEAKLLIGELRREGGNRVREKARNHSIEWTYARMPDGSRALRVKRTDVDRVVADLLKEWGYGHCAEQAAAAYWFLVDEMGLHGSSVDLCDVMNGDHAVVVIGRRSNSDPEDMRTWGADAVVCDPWANKAYPLSKFEEMQRPENDIRDILDPEGPHYLAGLLRCAEEEIGIKAD